MKRRTCCFIGHRKINQTDSLKSNLIEVIEKLIKEENVSVFAFGSKSEFNTLCHELVTDLQKKFNWIERVCLTCRSEICVKENEKEKWEEIYNSVLKQKNKFQAYEREIEHSTKYTSGRAAYVKRNRALIDMSDFCIFYYDKDYLPAKRKNSKQSLSFYQPKSGTALAYNYAKQKKKNIINIFDIKNPTNLDKRN